MSAHAFFSPGKYFITYREAFNFVARLIKLLAIFLNTPESLRYGLKRWTKLDWSVNLVTSFLEKRYSTRLLQVIPSLARSFSVIYLWRILRGHREVRASACRAAYDDPHEVLELRPQRKGYLMRVSIDSVRTPLSGWQVSLHQLIAVRWQGMRHQVVRPISW